MAKLLATNLILDRCPHCSTSNPTYSFVAQAEPKDFECNTHYWRMYACSRCAYIVSAVSYNWDEEIVHFVPKPVEVSKDIPDRARAYLEQAINCASQPAGAVMLAASAVDAMLKAKNLVDGNLYSRINEAKNCHMITEEMAQWAHDVRLDANDQRHADNEQPLPNVEQAQKCIDFATALGEFMFVLPAKVMRGLKAANDANTITDNS